MNLDAILNRTTRGLDHDGNPVDIPAGRYRVVRDDTTGNYTWIAGVGGVEVGVHCFDPELAFEEAAG